MLRLLLAVLVTLGTAAPAQASSVWMGGGILSVTGDDGERNDLLITYVSSGTYTVAERGALVTLRRLTSQCTDAGGGVARCTGVSSIVVDAGDGADVVASSGVTIATTITDGAGDDVVSGGGGNDVFVGSPGDDVLAGGAGNDRFGDAGGTGADTIDGGTGTDTADYSGRWAPLAVSLDGVAGDGEAGERDDIKAGIDEVLGGSGADRLTGADGYQWLKGNGGDDVLDGRSGGDRLQGDGGQDTADYRSRTVRVVVSADGAAGDGASGENDNVLGDVDSILSGSGNDELTGNSWYGTIDGGAGDDTLRGGDGHDEIRAGDGADDVDGGNGDDTIDGGTGPDAISGGSGSDVVDYSTRSAAVTVDLKTGATGPAGEGDTIDGINGAYGGRGNDVLRGDDHDGRWDGGPGNDHLDGRGGADRMAGGDGLDRVDYGSRSDDVKVWVDDSSGDGEDGENDNVRRDVEHVTTGSGDDRWGGDESSEVFAGGAGDDQAWGNGGDDTIDGGDHRDQLWPGKGNDTVRGGSSDDRIGGDAGNDSVDGEAGNDTLDGGRGNDHLAGGDGADELGGGNGDDSVAGGSGNDTLSGDDGTDHLYGHDGDDRLNGGDDSDGLDAGAGRDRLSGGNGPDALTGGPDDDKLSADNGDDRLDGGDGADELGGGSDDDVLAGGPGADRIQGDSGEDTVDYSARTEPLRITNDDKADDGAAGERDDVGGSVDHFIGGAGNDLIRTRTAWNHRLWGEGGNDTLDGGPKTDQLVGGRGNDQLIGREGKDLFDAGDGADKVSGSDGAAEVLRCGPGKDSAVRDGADKAVSCEKLRRGSGATSQPAAGDTVPVASSPGRRIGTKRVYSRGRFVAIPGFPGEKIDRRLLKDIAYLKSKYKIAITDGYALTGHARDGEHPIGLGLDIVPGAGGSWADIDRLARWAEPRRNRPRAPFRWVGYNGDPGHGRGHHLHLSWRHAKTGRGKPAKWVEVLSFKAGRPTVRVSNLTPLSGRSNRRMGGAPSVRTGARSLPRCRGAAQLKGTWKAAGRAFKIDWRILAAITEIESGFGCNMGPSSAGALGWTQFMPATWKTWGMDADGDGKASPYSSADAIFSSARYLRASGAPRSYRKALFAYNHAQWYVNDVLKRAKKYG